MVNSLQTVPVLTPLTGFDSFLALFSTSSLSFLATPFCQFHLSYQATITHSVFFQSDIIKTVFHAISFALALETVMFLIYFGVDRHVAIVHKKYAYFPYFMVFLKYGSTGENCPYFFRTSREKKSHLKFAWKRKRPVPSPAHFLVEMIEGACGGWGVQHSLG